jgi:hypothetical protein
VNALKDAMAESARERKATGKQAGRRVESRHFTGKLQWHRWLTFLLAQQDDNHVEAGPRHH